MTTDTATPETAVETADSPSVRDLAAEFGRMQAFDDAWKAHFATKRAAFEDAMIAKAPEVGRRFGHDFGGGAEVTYTLKDGDTDDKISVGDMDALVEWAEVHHPTEVEVKVVVRPSFVTLLTGRCGGNAETGEVFDTETGEPVPGLKFTPGQKDTGYKGFGTSWAKKGAGKDLALSEVLGSPEALSGLLAIEAPAGDR